MIDTRSAVPGKIIGTLHSIHTTPDAVIADFAANKLFQREHGEGKHIMTIIATLRERQEPLRPGELVHPGDVAGEPDPKP